MEIMVTEPERDLILAALHELIKKGERNRAFVFSVRKRRDWENETQVARDLLGRILADKATETPLNTQARSSQIRSRRALSKCVCWDGDEMN